MHTPAPELAVRMREDQNASTTSLTLIGNMKLVEPGGEVISLRKRKTRAVLAILALASGEKVLRSRLTGLLWDQSNGNQARSSLRHALSELNSLVNGRIPGLIEIEREAVRLDTEKCWIDVDAPGEHVDH